MAKMLASRRTPLSSERILDAAVELLDRDGLDALSMRHLGAALGVEAMSLYRHFPSKVRLLEGLAGRLLSELALPVPAAAPWDVPLRAGVSEPPAIPAGADPYIAERWSEIALADCDEAFEFGLDVLIAGFDRVRGR